MFQTTNQIHGAKAKNLKNHQIKCTRLTIDDDKPLNSSFEIVETSQELGKLSKFRRSHHNLSYHCVFGSSQVARWPVPLQGKSRANKDVLTFDYKSLNQFWDAKDYAYPLLLCNPRPWIDVHSELASKYSPVIWSVNRVYFECVWIHQQPVCHNRINTIN